MPASEARGRNWLPGSTTARPKATGMSSSETTSVVGWPMTTAGDMPMYTFLPLNLRFTTSCVFSATGFRPSINKEVMRGMSSITAPIVTPRKRIFLMSSWASAPISAPTITPNTSGSPSMPNFFFKPSASIFSFSKPGIMSRALPISRAKGTKLWQKGCGMEMPCHSG